MIARKRYLIKPRIQLKYIVLSICLTLISAGGVYLVLWHTLFRSGWLVGLDFARVEGLQNAFRHSFLWAALGLVIISTLDILFRFHRVMGPVYASERALKIMATGDLTQETRTRKDDELKDFTFELFAMREGLRELVQNDRKLCGKIDERLAKLASSLANSNPALAQEAEAVRKDLSAVSFQFKV